MEEKMNQSMSGQNRSVTQPESKTAWTQREKGISSSTLKFLAVITMMIDHFGAGVLGRYLSESGLYSLDMNDTSAINFWMAQNAQLYGAYSIMRMIGRIAFPIYCFLLVEGFEHTRDRVKYAQRLLIFAAVSEIPFDLLFKGKILEFSYQNVFFTLFCGLAVMMGLRWTAEHMDRNKIGTSLMSLGIIAAGMAVAQLLKTDYAAIGVVCIVVLYLFRKKKAWQIIAGCAVFLWELTAPLAFVPIAFYNGKRGLRLKYFFYLVYPVHLLLFYLLCAALGINSYPAM